MRGNISGSNTHDFLTSRNAGPQICCKEQGCTVRQRLEAWRQPQIREENDAASDADCKDQSIQIKWTQYAESVYVQSESSVEIGRFPESEVEG